MKRVYFPLMLICSFLISSCEKKTKRTLSKPSQNSYNLPLNWSLDVLFDEKDTVILNDSTTVLTKGNHDMIVYIPIDGSSEKGYLCVSHETIIRDSLRGDGGGATIFEIAKRGLHWNVLSKKYAIDFSTVNQTALNCGGKLTPNGTILMAEEICPENNKELRNLDSSKYLPTNFGWIVEVNPITKKAIRKLRNLGRYKHEDILVMPDNKTMYMTNDDTPAILFKFIADSVAVYTKGKLYAYNEKDSIHWIALPMDKISLENARHVAIEKGATMFVRHEWLSVVGNRLYITETGNDIVNWKEAIKRGGIPASYFKLNRDSISHDFFGRVLSLDLHNDSLSIFYEGNSTFFFFFCIANITMDSVEYLILAENIIGETKNRSLETEWGNGLWLFNIKTKVTRKIMQAPKGSEITGLNVTPNQRTLFVNIQHPDESVKTLNGSTTLAIQIGD